MSVHKYFRAGYALPRVLVFIFALDLLFRFIPFSALGFRAGEGATRRRLNVVGPFTPNIQIKTPSTYGDLANLGNLPAMREYRSSTFTTDSLGFNNPFPQSTVPQVIFLGDSFALPSDVPESRTFASQLADLRGSPVFNAGGVLPLRLAPLRDLSPRLGMKTGYVVYEFLERHLDEPPPLNTDSGGNYLHSIPAEVLGVRRWEEIRLPLRNYILFSPLQAMVQKLDKSLCDDILLPNRYTQNVLIHPLKNGDSLLFLAHDLASQKVTASQVAVWASYFEWYSEQLKQEGLTLVVLLIPNKYTVYGPSFSFPANTAVNERNLGNLQNLLAARQIPVVNLLGPFRAQAAADLDSHLYLYWKDDTHWNERGMSVAAKQVADVLSMQDLAPDPRSVVSP